MEGGKNERSEGRKSVTDHLKDLKYQYHTMRYQFTYLQADFLCKGGCKKKKRVGGEIEDSSTLIKEAREL